MSELAEVIVMVNSPFAYNKYPSKLVTAIHTQSIDGTHTCLVLPMWESYF